MEETTNIKTNSQLHEEIKSLQVRIAELEKSESRYKVSENLLQKSELQQKAILNSIPDIAWLKNKESKFIAVNIPFAQACGKKPEELCGKNDLDIWPKNLAEKYRADDAEVIETRKRKCVEEQLEDAKGKLSWIETIKTPVFDANGDVIGTVGIARDISERKKYEERLREARAELEIRVMVRTAELAKANEDLRREIRDRQKSDLALVDSEKKHRSIFQNAPVCIWEEDFSQLKRKFLDLSEQGVTDFRDYIDKNPGFLQEAAESIRIVDVNNTTLKVFGAKDKSELKKSLSVIIPPEGQQAFKEAVIAFAQGKAFFESECVNKNLKGNLINLYLSMVIPQDIEGAKSVIVTMADISKLKLAEVKAFEASDRFKNMFDNSIQGMLLADAKSRKIILSNTAMQEMLGYSAEELKQMQIDDIHPKENVQEIVKKFEKLSARQLVNTEDIPIKRRDGSIAHTHIASSNITVDGRLCMLGTFNDITNRIERDVLIKQEKDRFMELFNSISSGVIVYKASDDSRDFIITDFNHSAELIEGVKREKVIGKKVTKIFPAAKKSGILDDLRKVWETNQALSLPATLYIDEKRAGWRENYIYKLPSGEIVMVYNDVTKHKQIESELIESNKKLKELALTDYLTGLFNYHFLQEAIEAEFDRAKRYAALLTVIMIDIDYFKSINDVYGHQFGDLVLKQFAKQMKMMVRRYDLVIRHGGEEFVIISPGIGKKQGLALAQRILDAMSLYHFGDKKHSVKLKISLSVVSYPEDRVAKGMALINLSAQILNKAKELGGNRVCSSKDVKRLKQESSPKTKTSDIKVLQNKIDKLTMKSKQGLVEAIVAFAKTIELKDHYTGEHVENTVRYTVGICKKLNLPEEETELIKQAAILHDLGKIGISEKILLKKGRLTKEEFEEIKMHPQIAADILRPIQSLQGLIPLVFYHHERWDGKGYPSGIKGEEIPIGSRIIAVADVYQALTSDRPYRKAFKQDKAIKIIKEGAGSQFDPQIVDIFLKILQKKSKSSRK
jgi:diguanylate cyclase (GGDEF)-like protein/PAS domain S-box-containing protein